MFGTHGGIKAEMCRSWCEPWPRVMSWSRALRPPNCDPRNQTRWTALFLPCILHRLEGEMTIFKIELMRGSLPTSSRGTCGPLVQFIKDLAWSYWTRGSNSNLVVNVHGHDERKCNTTRTHKPSTLLYRSLNYLNNHRTIGTCSTHRPYYKRMRHHATLVVHQTPDPSVVSDAYK